MVCFPPRCSTFVIALGFLCTMGTGSNLGAMEATERTKAKEELVKVAQEAFKLSRAFELIHEIVGPSVASIHILGHERYFEYNQFDIREVNRLVPIGEGSGFIVHSEATSSYVLTNAHVVVQMNQAQQFLFTPEGEAIAHDKVRVVLNDHTSHDAVLVGVDVETDLAVLKINVPKLSAVDWADSDQARVGDWVLALGYPFGVGYSATSGIISATDRSTEPHKAGYRSFLQTDAAINPGNSGGPLVNLEGKVIGVNSNILSKTGASIGIGFAIPSNLAYRVADDLVHFGRVVRAMIGVDPQDISPERAVEIGLPQAQSVQIALVVPKSPAEEAGLKADDVILAVNKAAIQSVQQFRARVASLKVGQATELRVWRKGTGEFKVNVTPVAKEELQSRLDQAAEHSRSEPRRGLELLKFGLRLGTDTKPGLVILEVAADSAAARAGLKAHDRVLHEREEGALKSLADLTRLAGRKSLALQVLADGRNAWMELRR